MNINASKRLQRLRSNITKSISGFGQVFCNPFYVMLALIFAFCLSILIYFFANHAFYWSLLTSNMAIFDKFSVIFVLAQATISSYFSDVNGIMLAILSLLQGIALALLAYQLSRGKKLDKKVIAGGGLSTVAAIVGLGCVPCGTSLLIPIIALFFSSTSYGVLYAVNGIVSLFAIVLSLFAVYKTSLIVYVDKITSSWKDEANRKKIAKI